MTTLSESYKLPPELLPFVENGFLELLSEKKEKQTVEFFIPSRRGTDEKGRINSVYSLTWIHPDHNAEFCHFYENTPGDLPNFFVTRATPDHGDEILPDLDTLDDLIAWLTELQEA